jgi:Fe-S-cluster-containing dehydrogenase component
LSQVKSLFLDPSRCIGCRSCVAACRECDTHKGESMIYIDYVRRGRTIATAPTLCMHCEEPVAPCAQVCPAQAILVSSDGVVHQADVARCIGCQNCVHACPFGVPKFDVDAKLMMKCNLCYDRTSQGRGPMCATVCPTQAIFYGTYAEFAAARNGRSVNDFAFGEQRVRARNFYVLPVEAEILAVDVRDLSEPAPRLPESAAPFSPEADGLPVSARPAQAWTPRREVHSA